VPLSTLLHAYKTTKKMHSILIITCISQRENINIQHALNGGEKQIGSYFVDGYTVLQIGVRTVYEVHGCFWHGRPKCFQRIQRIPSTVH
jgi:hypothetical protein